MEIVLLIDLSDEALFSYGYWGNIDLVQVFKKIVNTRIN
jgi:hypothetical protein